MAETPVDPELIRVLTDEAARVEISEPVVEAYAPEPPVREGRHKGWREAEARRRSMIAALRAGMSVGDACSEVGVVYQTYASWRQRYPLFASKADEAKLLSERGKDTSWDGTRASLHAHYFGRQLTWFQLLCIRELESMPLGNILLVLWPPDHGKTSTYEDFACSTLALDPAWRGLVVAESRPVAQKILGAVMDRMDPMGPTPAFVERFGPFMPQNNKSRQPWSDVRFNVYKARHTDQRDYSMAALGAGSKQILSARTNHAHGDDIQSLNTINQTDRLESWIRQDFFSRAGEHGRNSLFGSRIADDDVWERLLDDTELDDTVMKVIKLRAIYNDPDTGQPRPLWPERYNLDQLERMRKKNKEGFDRNYMQSPGLTSKGKRTFTKDKVEPCLDSSRSLLHRPPANSIVYIGLDPAIGGKNAVIACEATPDYQLIVRRIQEAEDLFSNNQVIGEVEQSVEYVQLDGAWVTDVIIEDKAFQKGLFGEEALLDLQNKHGFMVHGHQTGLNKYDTDLGVPSMVTSFIKKEIVLPWADDDYTRSWIGELQRQLYAWKPGVKGNRLRQDLVMALWFCWLTWRQRWKRPATASNGQRGFKTQGLPWTPTKTGILVPAGATRS